MPGTARAVLFETTHKSGRYSARGVLYVEARVLRQCIIEGLTV